MVYKIKDNYDYNLSYMNQDGGIITDTISNANLFSDTTLVVIIFSKIKYFIDNKTSTTIELGEKFKISPTLQQLQIFTVLVCKLNFS
jgi:hypothetical protein